MIPADKIIHALKKAYPDAACSLNFKTPHQLLVATILSAQCTDERVNAVTPALFEKYKSPTAFAQADIKELENDIRSTGFFRNKAKAIRESSRIIVGQFNSRMPRRMEDLVKLPGVGRKTASVILGTAFGKAEGIVVDTHVARLSKRLGFTSENDPVKIENDLIQMIPKKEWIIFSHLMIFHGRSICKARRPECRRCVIANYCPSAKLFL
ncbi:MAG: endonuclease III [candidate division Zixibacteria bacterium]|nr:endonuclease III [candidate division Zixibacteria bacterium]